MRPVSLILLLAALAACGESCREEGGEEPPETPARAVPERTPQMVADFLERPFTNQDGETMRLADLAGRAIVLAYIYTSCPVQTMCPLTTEKMVQVQKELPEELRDRVALVSITLDPDRDPPAALKMYGEFYDVDFSTWSFLTAGEDAIRASADCCKVTFSTEDNGMIGHNLNLVIFDPAGQIAREYPGPDWQVPSVLATLRKLTAPQSTPRVP